MLYHCPSVVSTHLSPRRAFYQILRKTKVLRNNMRWGRRGTEDESLTQQHTHRHPAQVRCHPARTNCQSASWKVPTGFQMCKNANRLQIGVHCQRVRDTLIKRYKFSNTGFVNQDILAISHSRQDRLGRLLSVLREN